MPSTPNLNITHLDSNSDQPEVPVNASMDGFDAKITGKVTIDIGSTSPNVTSVTQADQAKGSFFYLSPLSPGPVSDFTVDFAAYGMGIFAVYNATSYSATLEISGQALTAPSLASATLGLFVSDGVNVRVAVSSSSGVTGPGSSTDGDIPQFDGTSGGKIKDGLGLDTDGTLAANSDTKIPSQKAVSSAIAPAPSTQTSSYTLVVGDAFGYVRMNSASANNLTVPPNSSVAFRTGTEITIEQMGAGTTTVVAGSGVTMNTANTLVLAAQYAVVTLKKVATDEWTLIGYTG